MTQIGIFGVAGRMGRAIVQIAVESGLPIAGGTARAVAGELAPGIAITADPQALATASDVLIDFSVPAALAAHLDAALQARKPILIGTTGLEPDHHAAIDAAAAHIPVLQTGNTSLGVNLLAALVERAAAGLGDDWDIEIMEMHHRHKVDAPSGTALLLGEAAARGRGIVLADHSERGRDGITGARARGAIGFAALRLGQRGVPDGGGGTEAALEAGQELVHQARPRPRQRPRARAAGRRAPRAERPPGRARRGHRGGDPGDPAIPRVEAAAARPA